MKDLDRARLEELQSIASLLEDIQKYVDKHRLISYVEFDYYIVHNMTLFSIEPDFDFEKLEKTIELVRKSLPAVKRIFNKPIIILKDTDDVLPVENARIINQNTLLHLANHSQHVSNLTRTGVKPRKLLTRHFEDDYNIYENIIFCNYIDEILSLVNRNRRIFDNMLYASDIMKFNLLEKVNHVNYFLALGKLHTGYIRDFNQYFSQSKKLIHELSFISQSITPRLYKPIYKKNAKRNPRLTLKKTNIFLMQKDYHSVYKTYKYLLSNQSKYEGVTNSFDYDALSKNYLTYIGLLAIFAAGHFNFEIDSSTRMNLSSLNLTFTYKDWKLDVVDNLNKELLLIFNKDITYKMMITDKKYSPDELARLHKEYELDEVIVVTPFYDDYLKRDDIYISMQDIDSFRRIQQIILKGMIHSDTQRNVCPFCGGTLQKDRYKHFYQCEDCLIQIKQDSCPDTNKPYFFTDNTQHKKHTVNKPDIEYDEHWYFEKQVEALMYYRNITRITQNSEIVCPHCHKVHENKS